MISPRKKRREIKPTYNIPEKIKKYLKEVRALKSVTPTIQRKFIDMKTRNRELISVKPVYELIFLCGTNKKKKLKGKQLNL